MTLSLASLPDPTEADPSCERYGTEAFPLGKTWLTPRRRLPYRPGTEKSAVRAATQRPTLPLPEHPVVADSLPLNLRIQAVELASLGFLFRRPREWVRRS
jgi:hypothetical protein